jgi:glycine cleavage system H protein
MNDYLKFQVGKFIFKVATDRLYSDEGMWVKRGDRLAEVGISDYLQQRSGDVAFAEIKPVGTLLSFDDEVAVIETIKVNISLGSPVTGGVVDVNPAMTDAPEAINQDPYGKGWMAVIDAINWEADRSRLMDPKTYFEHMKSLAQEELNKG